VELLAALAAALAAPAALGGRLSGCEEFDSSVFVSRGYGCEVGCWGGVSGAGEEAGGARPAKNAKAVTIMAAQPLCPRGGGEESRRWRRTAASQRCNARRRIAKTPWLGGESWSAVRGLPQPRL
jgi:hypothetical protein